jgi:uncharacterized coiled-coil protein SlyX
MKEKELNNLKYRQLQKLAKEYGIKANQSSASIIKALLGAFEKNNASSKNYALEKVEAELTEQQALVRKTREEQEALIEKLDEIEEKLEDAELGVESAKFKVEAIKRKNHIEEILWRFPHLGAQILEKLDNTSLVNCREISTRWKKFVDSDKTLWIQQIQKHISMSNPSVKKTLQRENRETLQKLANSSKKSFNIAGICFGNIKEKPTTIELLPSLLSQSRYKGNAPLKLVKLIINNLEDKNPWIKKEGSNALSLAAKYGIMEVYELISKELDDKNPSDRYRSTPLHYAATYGNYKICKFITQNTQNLESLDILGKTPLQLAEKRGYNEISKLLKTSVEEQKEVSRKSKKRRLK